MRTLICFGLVAAALLGSPETINSAKAANVYPMAVLGFDERGAGAKEMGAKVVDLLFAKLVVRPELYLVDRAELKKVLEEQALSASGAVKADEAVKVGQLTGARLIVT